MDAFDRCNAKLDEILRKIGTDDGLGPSIRKTYRSILLTQQIGGILLMIVIFASVIVGAHRAFQ